jgi:hypothetical protein
METQDRAGSPVDYEHLIAGIFAMDQMILAIGTLDLYDLYMKIRVRLELNVLHRLYLRTQVGEMNDADVFLNEPYRRLVSTMPTPCFHHSLTVLVRSWSII